VNYGRTQNSIGLFMVAAIAILAVALTGCGYTSPDAGHESVLVKKPFIFGHGGVDSEPVKTGLTFTAMTTDAITVNMQPQQFAVHFDDLMSSDGVPLDFDGVIRLQVTDSVSLIKNFGEKWYGNNVEVEFRNRARQSVRKHGMNETAISTKAIEEIDREVSDSMEKYLVDAKLPLRLVQITVGKANPPDSIKSQRVETAAQQQRVLTEGQRKLAEDSRMEAEKSRAKADNAYREAMQLSPDQFLKLETIKMQEKACAAGHCTFLVGGGVVPTVDARK
jgi:regulator of protease activity HflC (stomatin/prohibitin superfamily)